MFSPKILTILYEQDPETMSGNTGFKFEIRLNNSAILLIWDIGAKSLGYKYFS